MVITRFLQLEKKSKQFTLETISLMDAEDAELITVYYGEDTKEEDARKLEEMLTAKYPSCDIELYAAGSRFIIM